MPFIILFSLILIHEIGHIIAACVFKIEVKKICIYPFGGLSKFNLRLNEDLTKELIILIMGPLIQLIYYFLIIKINYFERYIEVIKVYNYSILIFNLLPIYPLDGGRLLNIVLSYFISFKKSLKITSIISYIIVIIGGFIFILKNISTNSIIIITFLMYKVTIEVKKQNYLFNKFLLERYLYKYQFKKIKKVSNLNQFMRNKKHIIKINNKYYTEKEILNNKFNNKC